MKKTSVVILGGGFAGLSAAMYLDKKLARRADMEVTLISRENFILFTPMLHEVAAGDLYPGDIVNPLRRILHHVKFVQAEVQAIDLSARRVRCVGGVASSSLTSSSIISFSRSARKPTSSIFRGERMGCNHESMFDARCCVIACWPC
jgi:NADH dehydrogenase FAD-containing subunit